MPQCVLHAAATCAAVLARPTARTRACRSGVSALYCAAGARAQVAQRWHSAGQLGRDRLAHDDVHTAPTRARAAASSTPSSGVMNGAARRIPDDMRHPKTRKPSSHSRTRARGLCGSGRRVDRRGSAQRAGRSFGWPCADAAGSRRRCGGDAGSATAPNRVREPCAQGMRGTREGWHWAGRGHMSWTGGSSTQSATVASCTASYLTTPQPIDPQPLEPLSRWVAHSNKSWPRRRAITRGARVAYAWRMRLVARVWSHAFRTRGAHSRVRSCRIGSDGIRSGVGATATFANVAAGTEAGTA
jgi:hypothetical protein